MHVSILQKLIIAMRLSMQARSSQVGYKSQDTRNLLRQVESQTSILTREHTVSTNPEG